MPFLETCKSYRLCPTVLSIRKKPFIEFESDELKVFWKQTTENTKKDLMEALCVGISERMFSIEKSIWMSYINWKRILTMKTLRNG